jgi:GNAT superfamily N-acetyltransferase
VVESSLDVLDADVGGWYLRREASEDDALQDRRRLRAVARVGPRLQSPGSPPLRARSFVIASEPKGQPVDLHSPSSAPSLDHQLQRYLRGAASRDRDVERLGPFLATFDPHSTIPYLSYAIPDDGARPTAAEVAALADAYVRHDRVPRLEYLPIAAPDVEAALVAGGFVVDARLPVMTCERGAALALAPDDGIAITTPGTDEDVLAMRAAQHTAFGEVVEEHADGGVEELARRRRQLADGGLALLARDRSTGEVVAGGVATVPREGVTEIGGIGVLESHRRRGIAGAITAGLTRAAHAAGTTIVWLTPGDDGAHRVYARAGFTDTTSQVHLSRPS